MTLPSDADSSGGDLSDAEGALLRKVIASHVEFITGAVTRVAQQPIRGRAVA